MRRSPVELRSLRGRFIAGEHLIGTFCNLGSALAVEACAAAGVDWVLIDTEHGPGGEAEVAAAVTAAAAYGVPTLVRVESTERIRIGSVLDLGAAGVMAPRIDSAAAAARFVSHLRYPPLGDRGAATYNRQGAFGLATGALDAANTGVVGIVQIETLGALNEVAEIAAIDGVDALFVGPVDLSYALKVPMDFARAEYQDALDRVVAACTAHGKTPGILVNTAAAAQEMLARGFGFVAIGSDSTMLATALHTAVTHVGESSPRPGGRRPQ